MSKFKLSSLSIVMIVVTFLSVNSVLAQGSISGVVTNADTGEPIAEARVFARGDGWQNSGGARTDAEGGYEIVELAAGSYSVFVAARGFDRELVEVEVVEGENTVADVVLTPERFGSVVGQVTDAEGVGIANAIVSLAVAMDDDDDDGDRMRGNRTRTDEEGNYSFESVDTGDYNVSVRARDYLPAGPEAVTVVDGEVSEVNFVLEGETFGSITGFVRDVKGEGIANAVVSLNSMGRHGHRGDRVRTNEDGSYTFDRVEAGDYALSARASNYASSEAVEVSIAGDDVVEVDFVLEGLTFGAVSGFVTDADTGDAIEGAYVGSRRNWTQTDADGFYVIEGVAAGTTRVFAFARGYMWGMADVEVVGDETAMADFALEPRGNGGGGGDK